MAERETHVEWRWNKLLVAAIHSLPWIWLPIHTMQVQNKQDYHSIVVTIFCIPKIANLWCHLATPVWCQWLPTPTNSNLLHPDSKVSLNLIDCACLIALSSPDETHSHTITANSGTESKKCWRVRSCKNFACRIVWGKHNTVHGYNS